VSELAIKFREAARRIKSAIPQVYVAKKTDESLDKLLESSERELLPTLQLTADNKQDYSFVDIYAQTIAYALFTARVFSYIKDKQEETETFLDRELV